ncbi:hypothetical protein B484DRAFT_456351, partial [Ochromonadaceae sp. CCMP2298]
MRKFKYIHFIDGCGHGAPVPQIPEITGPVFTVFHQLSVIPDVFVARAGRVAVELPILETFCAEEPLVAANPVAPLILVGMAADALKDMQYRTAQIMLRTAFFLEAYQMYDSPGGLSADLHAESDQEADATSPGLRHLAETAQSSLSIKGIFEHICKRVKCRCFV